MRASILRWRKLRRPWAGPISGSSGGGGGPRAAPAGFLRMPVCRQGILAGTVLAFARALGEYGATSMIAGYTPGRTATISTTVYQLWRTDNDTEALRWVLVNIAISAVFLLAVNLLEARQKRAGKGGRR